MYPKVKRVADLVVALILLLLLFPVVAIVGVLVFVLDGRPTFFRQVRPGLGEKPFVMVKIRTMSQAPAAANGDESPRVTKLGAILRKTSIDELPQIFNVIKGEMSLVGPRPTSWSPESYKLWQTERLDVLPPFPPIIDSL